MTSALTDAHAEFLADAVFEIASDRHVRATTPRERQILRELVAAEILTDIGGDCFVIEPTLHGMALLAKHVRSRSG